MCLLAVCMLLSHNYVMHAIDMVFNKRPLTLQHCLPSSAKFDVRLNCTRCLTFGALL